MMDIDHFKRINDRHGHLAGDEVLREVAQNIRTVCRRSDVCARFGGEEFAVILPQTSAEQGIVLAERLREQMMQARIELDGRELTVTISLGVATMPPVLAHRCEDLVDQADQALYCAKHAGRNRTVVAGEEPDPLPGAEPSPVPSDGRPAIA
jgi:diguanylate cyclase (GGDEF)-like protein